MKMNYSGKFFLLFVILFTLKSLAVENRSTVEFQWEEDSKAAEYEVEILNQEGTVLKELKSKTNSFRVRMPVNKYKIRGRIKTKLGNYSPWSKESELVIPPFNVKITHDSPSTKTLSVDSKTMTSSYTVIWKLSPQAIKYIVKIKDEHGQVIRTMEVLAPVYKMELPPGKYKYSITAVSQNGISSDEIESKETLYVKMSTLSKPIFKKTITKTGRLHFEFEKIPGVIIRGELHYANFLGETWTPVEKYDELKESLWEASFIVKPGRYKIYFWSSAKGAADSEKILEEFIIKPKETDLAVAP